MSNKAIFTPNAPAAIGPYSQAVQAGNTVYVSGQLPIDPAPGAFAGEDIASQTRQSLTNMKFRFAGERTALDYLNGREFSIPKNEIYFTKNYF